ncbi:MAG: DNA repair protein RecN [Fimbriimonadales bacterium]|nr:DNA repair protein RecN [Fimbriimonadales bacterium]
MLLELQVENLGIIEQASLQFAGGMTVITGETGAGKSLVVGSLLLALGSRADSSAVRAGSDFGRVRAAFRVSEAAEGTLREAGFDSEDGVVHVQRDVGAEGRSACRINGKPAPVAVVRQLGNLLADLHGQHDHQSLRDSSRHVEVLDAFGGEVCGRAADAVREAWETFLRARDELESLVADDRQRAQTMDLLRFQIGELEAAGITPGESEALKGELARLTHAHEISERLQQALDCVATGEPDALALLREAAKAVGEAASLDPSLREVAKGVEDAFYVAEGAAEELRRATALIEQNPTRLEQVAERLDTLSRLRRKYGETEEEMLEFLDRSRERLDNLEQVEAALGRAEAALEEAKGSLDAACGKLRAARKSAAKTLEAAVVKQIRELAMPHATFEVRVEPTEPSATGADLVEFHFSANKGEPVKPLTKVASGGELSRLMLAIETALAGLGGVPTLVFDEVDAGLGGETAALVGRKLADLGRRHQVIVITHLPQIACLADAHYLVEKAPEGKRTVGRVRLLGPEDRVKEIARMLSGEVGETSLAHAREMLTVSA